MEEERNKKMKLEKRRAGFSEVERKNRKKMAGGRNKKKKLKGRSAGFGSVKKKE